jgi:hypothetical protein
MFKIATNDKEKVALRKAIVIYENGEYLANVGTCKLRFNIDTLHSYAKIAYSISDSGKTEKYISTTERNFTAPAYVPFKRNWIVGGNIIDGLFNFVKVINS